MFFAFDRIGFYDIILTNPIWEFKAMKRHLISAEYFYYYFSFAFYFGKAYSYFAADKTPLAA